jgi:hypothetical protein
MKYANVKIQTIAITGIENRNIFNNETTSCLIVEFIDVLLRSLLIVFIAIIGSDMNSENPKNDKNSSIIFIITSYQEYLYIPNARQNANWRRYPATQKHLLALDHSLDQFQSTPNV